MNSTKSFFLNQTFFNRVNLLDVTYEAIILCTGMITESCRLLWRDYWVASSAWLFDIVEPSRVIWRDSFISHVKMSDFFKKF
jgi:hypothetical protein